MKKPVKGLRMCERCNDQVIVTCFQAVRKKFSHKCYKQPLQASKSQCFKSV